MTESKYIIREYAADGHGSHDNRQDSAATLRDARAVARGYVGGSLRARRWRCYDGNDEPAGYVEVESYHDYPEGHPDGYGCGGVHIYRRK